MMHAWCLQVVELKSDWPKGYSRLGGAYAGLRQWDEAKTAYETGRFSSPLVSSFLSSLSFSRNMTEITDGITCRFSLRPP